SDLESVDLEKFPLFAQAKQYRTVLAPGDTIFVPSRWWHTARVLSPSISVCTNRLDQWNWNGFVREVCLPEQGTSALKRVGKRAVLSGLGGLLSAIEGIGHTVRSAHSSVGSRLCRLAPRSPAEAVQSKDWPIEKWYVRSQSN